MFSWGEDRQQGFRVKKGGSNVPTADGVHFLNLTFCVRDLSAGNGALGFVKANGETSIICSHRGGGRQKYVKCEEKIQAVSLTDGVFTLLSENGTVLCVDLAQTPFNPRTPDALCNVQVCQVTCGSQHTVALTREGQVYAWGQDTRGQLGLGNKKPSDGSPQLVQSLSAMPLVQIAAGGDQSFALSVSGGVFGWGRNDFGQLGLGDTADRDTPTHVHVLDMKKCFHISCGMDHTAILTKDGGVFTFGSGEYGQLGHNSFSNEVHPRLVAEPWEAKIAKIACGWHHTLVLTDSGRLYSFGRGEQGQLGHGDTNHSSVPLRVHLTKDTSDDHIIRNIYAGGNCSFATCKSNEDVGQELNCETPQSINGVIRKWTSDCDSQSWKKIKQEIHRMFSSASCLNGSFLDQSKDKHFQTSPQKYSGLNLSQARRDFKKLAKDNEVLAEVEAAVLQLLLSLNEKPLGVEGLRIFLLLTELLDVTHKLRNNTNIEQGLAAALQKLSAESRQVVVDWWLSLPQSELLQHLNVWKRALGFVLSYNTDPRTAAVNLLLLLQQLHDANNNKIPEKAFGLEINQGILAQDLQLWRLNQDIKPLILFKFPFLMDLKSKTTAFVINVNAIMQQHQAAPLALGFLFVQPQPLYFELRLRRSSLIQDTFEQLVATPHQTFFKPLVVYFDGDTKVTQVYRKDFFHYLFRGLAKTDFVKFMFNDSKRLVWFPSDTTEEDRANYFLFGLLCGLALYNQNIIDLPFPLVLFKKLLGMRPTLEDMMEFSTAGGKSLESILGLTSDSDFEDLCMCFTMPWNGADVELDPANPGKPVTYENRQEYVDACVAYAFDTSVENVFQEFERGFFLVCDRDLVNQFRPEELQEVLVGNDNYDWPKLKKNAFYEFPFHNDHPTVKMFWEVFEELTEEQKKDLLLFVTGFRRPPALGMEHIRMCIRNKVILSLSYDEHFPESLTCHSLLELPLYSKKEIMREKLIGSLKPDKGFNM